jgi:hypothetical protein
MFVDNSMPSFYSRFKKKNSNSANTILNKIKTKDDNKLNIIIEQRKHKIDNMSVWFTETMFKHFQLINKFHNHDYKIIQNNYFEYVRVLLINFQNKYSKIINTIVDTTKILKTTNIKKYNFVELEILFDNLILFLRRKIGERIWIDKDTIEIFFKEKYPLLGFEPDKVFNCSIWTDNIVLYMFNKMNYEKLIS